MAVYKCTNKKCREYRKEFPALNPRDAKIATGKPIQCRQCWDIVLYVRKADASPNGVSESKL